MADPLSVAGSIAGLVAIADTVFTRTYRYARSAKNAEKDIAELASGIRSLSGLLHGLALVIEELQRDTQAETNFRLHHINACRATLTKVEKKLETRDPATSRHSRMETLSKKLKWPFSISETRELIVEVERHKTTINIALSADTLFTVFQALSRQDRISEELSELKSELKSRWAMETHISLGKERKEVLDYFGKVDSTLNHQTNLKLRHPLTGLWVTEGETFRSWLRIRNSKLWLSGVAGGGKTILAASLIEETMDDSGSNQAVAYFYCDYRDPEKQKPVNIIGSLAAQLGRQAEEAFATLHKLYKTCHPEDRACNSPEVSNLIATVLEMSIHFEEVSIIVDGLDECGTNTIEAIQSLNKLVANHHSNIRLLVLSREDLGIREVLEKEYTYLEIAAKSKDLELYVAAELEARKGAGRGRLRIKSLELKEHIMKTLVERAAGMFRWVSCQIDYLCELPTDAEKRKALTVLPPTLYETYERILEEVNRSGQGIQKMVQATLQWVVTSKGGNIPVEAICEAISIEIGNKRLDKEALYDEETILSRCSSLLQFQSITLEQGNKAENFELAHFTVKEFLTSIDSTSPFAQYAQNKRDIYSTLAKACLTYIMLEPFHSDVIEDFDKWNIQQTEYPLRTHAVDYWPGYAKHHWADETIVSLSQELFNPSKTSCFLSWARDYLYIHSSAYNNKQIDQRRVFDATTRHVLAGGVGPLHVAAALGVSKLCEWLLSSGMQIDQGSDLGTPLHCALMGTDEISEIFTTPTWFVLYAKLHYVVDNRLEVLRLLVNRGADLDKPYMDPYGQEYSCAKLALYSGTTKGSNHPLIVLVGEGGKLERDLLISFQAAVEDGDHHFSGNKGAYQEFIEALLEKLEMNRRENDVTSALLDIALQFKTFSGLDQIGQNIQGLSLEELQQRFIRAARYDQTGTMETLLSNSPLELPFIYGEDKKTPLHFAIQNEALNAAKLLISLRESVHVGDTEKNTPLHVAAEVFKGRDDACIPLLLDHGASLATLNKNGCTAWHVAAKSDNKTALKVFLKRDEQKDTSLATPEKQGFIPLFYAAKHKSLGAVELLLSVSSDTTQKCPLGMSVVHYVVELNSIDLLKMLPSKGFSLQERTPDDRTALHFVPKGVDPAIVRHLIESGVSPDAATKEGETPLHRLLRLEITCVIEVVELLATDIATSLANKNGNTPLYYALVPSEVGVPKFEFNVRNNYVELLERRGADLSSCNIDGMSSLWALVSSYKSSSYRYHVNFQQLMLCILGSMTDLDALNKPFSWILKSGDKFNEYLLTPICWAVAFGSNEIVELLLSKRVDVDIVCEPWDWSAIHYASFNGSEIGLYRRLLAQSKTATYCDSRGFYLPHIICEWDSKGKSHHLEALHDIGIDLNLPSPAKSMMTPLMLAARVGKLDIIKWLIEQKVDYRRTDNNGCQAVHYAAFGEYSQVLRAFIALNIDWKLLVNVKFHNGRLVTGWNVLHISANNRNAQGLRIILENKFVGVDDLTVSGHSALWVAAEVGLLENMRLLLSAGASPNFTHHSGVRLIHHVAGRGDFKTIEFLLRSGPDLGPDSNGLIPELVALGNGHLEIIKYIHEYRTKKEIEVAELRETKKLQVPNTGSSIYHISRALIRAISVGDVDFCSKLVNTGFDIRQPLLGCKGCSPFLLSLSTKRFQIARNLLDQGASTLGQLCDSRGYRKDTLGYSAVHIACYKGMPIELLQLILTEDFEAGSPAFRFPVSPLHIAVASSNHEAVQLLLEHETHETRSSDNFGELGHYSMAPRDRSYSLPSGKTGKLIINSIIKKPRLTNDYLLCDEPNSLTTDNITGTALHIAAFIDDTSMIRTLLEKGANPNLVNEDFETPLHIAASKGSFDTFNLLLQYGSNPSARNINAWTALQLAVISDTASSFKLMCSLLPLGFSTTNSYGNNLLDIASSSSKFSYLFFKGLDPYSKFRAESFNPIELAFGKLDDSPEWLSLLCNLGLDFSRCPEIVEELSFATLRLTEVKVLLKCLPISILNREFCIDTWEGGTISPLSQATRRGRADIMNLLIQAGVDLELDGDYFGTPLMSACVNGRLDSVRFLVRAGAKTNFTRRGKWYSALEAASPFEEIIRWLLVERFTDQLKITFQPHTASGQVVKEWGGVKTAEVIVDDWYTPWHGPTCLERARELWKLRKLLQGQTVEILGFEE